MTGDERSECSRGVLAPTPGLEPDLLHGHLRLSDEVWSAIERTLRAPSPPREPKESSRRRQRRRATKKE